MGPTDWYLIAFGGFLGLWLTSYVIELLRRQPEPPRQLAWLPDVQIGFATVEGLRLRYVVTGDGPTVLLLHTLRTQLDLFRKVVETLSREFRVYAFDSPGHGYSDIPEADYDAELFARAVRGFLQEMNVTDAVIVGESIGGALGLPTSAAIAQHFGWHVRVWAATALRGPRPLLIVVALPGAPVLPDQSVHRPGVTALAPGLGALLPALHE